MLKQRVLTALVLLPLVLLAIFAMPVDWFMLLLIIIMLQGSTEYKRLAGLSNQTGAHFMVPLQTIILLGLFWYRDHWDVFQFSIMPVICAVWLVMFIRLLFFKPGNRPDHGYQVTSFATGILSISSGWFAICWIRTQPDGSWWLLLLLLIVWAADTGAYFAGKTFGKHKLAPKISPGKTREGLFGGLVTAPLVALLAASLMPFQEINPARLVLVSLITVLVSVGGDLLISLHKRTSGFKDSSNLLPGHGGILDRIDSLIAAAPFFALGLLVLGR